jgi:hypothetical protein
MRLSVKLWSVQVYGMLSLSKTQTFFQHLQLIPVARENEKFSRWKEKREQ